MKMRIIVVKISCTLAARSFFTALMAFIKPFEAPKRSVKIKI